MAILVIADDLTGAAEIAGMALRYGLSAEIVHSSIAPTDKDVLIVNSNSRSISADKLLIHLDSLQAEEKAVPEWDWIYLKFDSALRGHIKTEIPYFRKAFAQDQVIFCPVHLRLNRVIRDGIYWIDGVPIAESDFAHDPEFPVRKSRILEALEVSWHLLADPSQAQEAPYVLAAVQDQHDLARWASATGGRRMYAGAGAFFEALLQHRFGLKPASDCIAPQQKSPALYVCGSKHENSLQRLAALQPENIVYWQSPGDEVTLARQICLQLQLCDQLVFAVARGTKAPAADIRISMAKVLQYVRQTGRVNELIIEGGATAGAVLEALGIKRLQPIWEYQQGVIRTVVPDEALYITLKPGSYPWAEQLWGF